MKKKNPEQNANPKICFQAFYWTTSKTVQINTTEIPDEIAFLSSLSKLLKACSIKYLSNTGKN